MNVLYFEYWITCFVSKFFPYKYSNSLVIDAKFTWTSSQTIEKFHATVCFSHLYVTQIFLLPPASSAWSEAVLEWAHEKWLQSINEFLNAKFSR